MKDLFEERNEILRMLALGKIRKYAAVLLMQFRLRIERVAEYFEIEIRTKFSVRLDEAHGRLIAACFYSKDAHRIAIVR